MINQNIEQKYVKAYYLAWIVFIIAAFFGEKCGLSFGFHVDLVGVLMGFYIPVIGLWAMHEKKDFGYIFLGISLCFSLVSMAKIIILGFGG